jgi:hypothetical protein
MASRNQPPRTDEASPAVRFEATLGTATRTKVLAATTELALDRLPDVDRKVRLLLSADDARRLVERGFEVHLLTAIPVAPLEPALVLTDKQSQDWLEQQVKGIRRKGGQ